MYDLRWDHVFCYYAPSTLYEEQKCSIIFFYSQKCSIMETLVNILLAQYLNDLFLDMMLVIKFIISPLYLFYLYIILYSK